MSEKIKAIDLFCGCGGLSTGIENAGFDIVWAIDNNKHTKETFDKNHEADMKVEDIRDVSPKEVELEKNEIDLVVGGPPCPTFSLVGRSVMRSQEGDDPEEDERHLLYQDFLRFVDYFDPEAFIMENVKGMLSAENKDGEPVVEVIKEEMEELGYEVTTQLLDACNYGVPQHRERLFFIANKKGVENPDMVKWETHREPENKEERKIKFKGTQEEVFPAFKEDKQIKRPWNTVADAILDLPPVSPKGDTPPQKTDEYTVDPVSEYQYWVRKGSDKLNMHECRGHNMRDLTLYKLLGEGVSYIIGDIPDEHQPYRSDIFPDNYKKQNPLRPSSTVVAHLYKDGHNFIHPTEARSVTPREAARLQSFKDDFHFPVSRTQTFKQIGNAVPPLLGQAVGEAVKEDIFE